MTIADICFICLYFDIMEGDTAELKACFGSPEQNEYLLLMQDSFKVQFEIDPVAEGYSDSEAPPSPAI